MKKLLVLAITGLISVTASATNWVQVSENSSSKTYVETDSITNLGKYRQSFVIFTYKEPQSWNYRSYDSLVGYFQYDCGSNPKEYRTLRYVLSNGEQVVERFDTATDWNYIYPNSSGYNLAYFVCSY